MGDGLKQLQAQVTRSLKLFLESRDVGVREIELEKSLERLVRGRLAGADRASGGWIRVAGMGSWTMWGAEGGGRKANGQIV